MDNGTMRSVLVTGASSGIGNATARYLAERGCRVYGTVRNEKAAAELREIPNVVPLTLRRDEAGRDRGRGPHGHRRRPRPLRSREQRRARRAGHDLDVDGRGALPHVRRQRLRPVPDDERLPAAPGRVEGAHRQHRLAGRDAVEELLRPVHDDQARDRVVHRDSARRSSSPTACSRASFSRAASRRTSARRRTTGTVARFQRAQPPFREEAEQILGFLTGSSARGGARRWRGDADAEESESNRKPSSPEIVAEAVYDALFSPAPKLHYLVGTKWEGDRVLNALFAKLLDENDNPKHDYSRDELVRLLDQHIALAGARRR